MTFTPADTTDYTTATTTVHASIKATPTLTWSNPADITYGTALSGTQLNATGCGGHLGLQPGSGTVLNAGNGQALSVTFTPTDTTDYTTATTTVSIAVNRAVPTITWAAPEAIIYGAALSATQLNATGSVSGTMAYCPLSGTVLGAGASQALQVTLAPTTDTTTYTSATDIVYINVNQAGTSTAATSTMVMASAEATPLGQAVTLTAMVSATGPQQGTPTDTVTFEDGGSILGTSMLSGGWATLTTSVMQLGNHLITASYGGDTTFGGSTSAALAVMVNLPDGQPVISNSEFVPPGQAELVESPSTDEGQVEVTLIHGAGKLDRRPGSAWQSFLCPRCRRNVLVSTPVQVSTQASGMIVISTFDIRSASVLGRDTAIIVFSYQGQARNARVLRSLYLVLATSHSSPRFPALFQGIDMMAHTIEVVLDKTSSPTLASLNGTIFTISIPAPVLPVVVAQASGSPPAVDEPSVDSVFPELTLTFSAPAIHAALLEPSVLERERGRGRGRGSKPGWDRGWQLVGRYTTDNTRRTRCNQQPAPGIGKPTRRMVAANERPGPGGRCAFSDSSD